MIISYLFKVASLTPRSPDPGRFCKGLRAKEHLGTLAPLERLGPVQRVVRWILVFRLQPLLESDSRLPRMGSQIVDLLPHVSRAYHQQ